jgi:hypothetical protein
MNTDEETEVEEDNDAIRAPLIEKIRRSAPLLTQDIDFDQWPIAKLRTVVERHEKHRAEFLGKAALLREVI